MNGVAPGRVSRGRRGLLLGAGVIGLAGAMQGGKAAAEARALLLGEVNVAARETVLAASSTDQSTLRVSNGDRIAVLGQAGDAFDIGEVQAGVCGAAAVGAGVYAVGSGDARGLEVRGAVSFDTAGLAIIPQAPRAGRSAPSGCRWVRSSWRHSSRTRAAALACATRCGSTTSGSGSR